MNIFKEERLELAKKNLAQKDSEIRVIEGDIEELRKAIYVLKNEIRILEESFANLRSKDIQIVSLTEAGKIKQTIVKVTLSLREKESLLAERLNKHRILDSEILMIKELNGLVNKTCVILEGPWVKPTELSLT